MPATIIAPGRITKDSVTRRAGESDVVSFSVAVNCFEKREKVTRFYDCSWFGKRAIAAAKMLTKGSAVCVTGNHSTREHEGKTYQQIEVTNCEFLGGGQRQGGGDAPAPVTGGGGYPDSEYNPDNATPGDDQFPFLYQQWGTDRA